MKCVVCEWPATSESWVRPTEGGPKNLLAFCSDDCKQQKLAAGFVEDAVLRGWDVFIPLHERLK